MTVAFHAWNPFQVFQIADIARAYKDSVLLFERRANMDFDRVFDRSILGKLGLPVIETTAQKIAEGDGQFSAIVCQTPFRFLERLRKTKRIAMQYSMTKEIHQYGAWRAIFDLNLMYGEYSRERVAPLAPCRVIGNPRFEPWFTGQLDQHRLANAKVQLDPEKKTILYLPTWGDLSSVPLYQSDIGKLSETYNVIAKVHHNTDAMELKRKVALGGAGLKSIFGASDDLLYLLDCADMVLSDYSGAIFDAINVRKPVILLQNEPQNLTSKKFGFESIEFARRSEIGPVADHPALLADVIRDAFENPTRFVELNSRLKAECFGLEIGCAAAGAEAIYDLVNGRIAPRAYYQIYLRDEILQSRNAIQKLKRHPLIRTVPKRNDLRLSIVVRGLFRVTERASMKVKGLFLHVLVHKHFSSVEQGLPGFARSLLKVMPQSTLLPVAKLLLHFGYELAAVESAELAALRGFGRPLNSLTMIAGRLRKTSLLQSILQLFERLPDRVVALNGRQAARTSEALGLSDIGSRYLQRSQEILMADILDSRSKAKVQYLSLKALIQQRFWADVKGVLPTIKDKKIIRSIELELSIAEARMETWLDLVELANRNAGAADGEFWCRKDGVASRLRDVGNVPVVEFLVPPYFADLAPPSDVAAHQRICAFLRSALSELESRGFAIVPTHQFWLNIANPTGNWPAISYHTIGDKPRWLHMKDSALPGYYRLDSQGYAGFSSLASLTDLPQSASSASTADVERVWEEVLDTSIDKRISKYQQNASSVKLPKGEFIFFPLQLIDDTVASLAWIPMLEAVKYVIQTIEFANVTLVIKRHPLCRSRTVERGLAAFGRSPRVFITTGSIHEILPHAKSVVTVNSGVGFEALLYGKSVITVGPSEYGAIATQCRTKADLFNATLNPPAVDIDRIKRFVWFYAKSSVRVEELSGITEWAMENQVSSSNVPSSKLAP